MDINDLLLSVGITSIPAAIGGLVGLWLVFTVLSNMFGKRGHVYTGLVLTRYDFNLRDAAALVTIEGRRTGLIAWVMSLLGLAKKYNITISARFVSISIDGMFDHDELNVPISMVAVSYWGLSRPAFWLIVGIGLLISTVLAIPTIIGAIVLFIAAALVLYLLYWRGQAIEVRISPGDGMYYGFGFFKTAAGTMEKAAKTAALINKLTYSVATVKESQ